MTSPSPRHRPPPPPAPVPPTPSPLLAWLRRILRGRRRDVTLTEPVGPVRRWLQRMALPLVALAVVLGLLGGYLYVNGRINSLEQDRRDRTAARDRQQVELKQQIDDAAEARTRKLELQLCELIVGTRVAPRVAKLRRELRCPAAPAGLVAGPAGSTAAPPPSASPTASTSPPPSTASSPTGTPSATSSPPPSSPPPSGSATSSPSTPATSTRPPALSPQPSCPALPSPCVLQQRCA